jgi:hypothetical protein
MGLAREGTTMTTRKFSLWKNLTIIILGGTGLATWVVGACGSMDEGHEVEIAAARTSRASVETVDQIPQDYVLTPGADLMHKDCVHQVPNGAVTHADLSVTLNGKTIAQYAACTHKRYRYAAPGSGVVAAAGSGHAPGTGNGWVEAGWAYSTQTQFTHMSAGSWIVPANPTLNQGQTIFFFPSLTNDNSIIQPVLQWGPSVAGGGAFWAYANWWVVGTTTKFVSVLQTASPGDTMIGSLDMTYLAATYQYWTITAQDASHGTTTSNSVEITEADPFNAAQSGVLEAYGVSSCSAFPSGSSGWTYFSQPVMYQGTTYTDRNLIVPAWFLFDYNSTGWTGPICNFAATTVDSHGNTTLDY